MKCFREAQFAYKLTLSYIGKFWNIMKIFSRPLVGYEPESHVTLKPSPPHPASHTHAHSRTPSRTTDSSPVSSGMVLVDYHTRPF